MDDTPHHLSHKTSATPPPLSRVDDIVEFDYNFNGWSAGINNATLYTCLTCGATITEMHLRDDARKLHRSWHNEQEARRG